MAALRGTRAPEGASLPAGRRPGIYREVQLWPGVTWGRDARCLCSWAVRYGVMQVKVRSRACTVHVPGRAADPWPALRAPAAAGVPSNDDLLASARAGAVTREMYDAAVRAWQREHRASLLAASLGRVIGALAEALEPAGGPAECGTRGGYNQHLREGTKTCPACRAAKRKPGELALREAA